MQKKTRNGKGPSPSGNIGTPVLRLAAGQKLEKDREPIDIYIEQNGELLQKKFQNLFRYLAKDVKCEIGIPKNRFDLDEMIKDATEKADVDKIRLIYDNQKDDYLLIAQRIVEEGDNIYYFKVNQPEETEKQKISKMFLQVLAKHYQYKPVTELGEFQYLQQMYIDQETEDEQYYEELFKNYYGQNYKLDPCHWGPDAKLGPYHDAIIKFLDNKYTFTDVEKKLNAFKGDKQFKEKLLKWIDGFKKARLYNIFTDSNNPYLSEDDRENNLYYNYVLPFAENFILIYEEDYNLTEFICDYRNEQAGAGAELDSAYEITEITAKGKIKFPSDISNRQAYKLLDEVSCEINQ